MAKLFSSITLDTRTLSSRKLGSCAIKRTDLNKLAPRIKKIVTDIERERERGDHKYRELPHDRLKRQAVAEFANRCRRKADNLVVLGIGGSALGNIALQNALNHPQYNLLSRSKRKGPRLFVMDNVDPVYFAS